jgi:DNA helicase-2/ATP-dependent DNA helicase PcrA
MTQLGFDLDELPPFGPSDLVELLGIPFSPEQLESITAPLEPYVVVAGAGSGKTTVMTARVVWLLATGQVQPEQVLGLTFTTKAAGELSSRVRAAVQRLSDRIAGRSLEEVGEPTVATYHAFAGRLIAEHGLRIGVEPGARLLTEAASVQLAHRVVTRTSRDLSTLGYAVSSIVENVRALDSELAEHCLEPAALREHDLAVIAEVDAEAKVSAGSRDMRAAAITRIELSHLVDEFRAARAARDLVDFSDQMRFGARLAEECPDVGAALRDQFRVVLLDEYQDTSVSQRRMLVGLFGGGHPVTAVGDPLQAIYGWRGASVANIDRFPEHFARVDGSRAPIRTLAENRRSGQRILDAANDLAQPLRALHPQVAPLVSPGGKEPGGVRVALTATYAEEMAWVGDRVRELVDAGTRPGEIAVLCRATSDHPALVRTLTDRGLAVEVVGVDGMLAMPEVAEVVAVLDVLHDSTANPSLVRLLTGPRWRIGLRDLALLGDRAAYLAGGRGRLADDAGLAEQLDAAVAGVDPADVVSLLDALDDPGELDYDPEALERFGALAAEIRLLRRGVGDPLPDLVHRIITVTGLDIEMAASPEVLLLHRSEGLASFVDLVAGFADSEGDASIGAFLAWLAMAARFDQVPELDRPPSPDAVQLMTVHRSKGLEWPVVVLPSLTAKVFPPVRGIARWTSTPHAVPYPVRGDAESLPVLRGLAPKDHKAFVDDCKTHDRYEELRLAYVAVTRAKQLVIASGSWWGPTQKSPRGPSPYLESLRDQALAGAGSVDQWAEAPGEDDTNPVLGDVDEVPWPPRSDDEVRERRVASAVVVRAHAGLDVEALRAEHTALAAAGGSSPLLGLDAADLELVRGWDDDIALILEERRAERSASRTVALPTSLSASDLVRLAADPELFAQRLARPMPSAPAPAARRGTRFHAWVEQHFGLRPLLEPDDLPGAADADLDSDEALTAMQEAFLRSAYADRVPLAVEVPFTLVLGGRVVPGRIDAVFATADADGTQRFEVVDWKTSRAHDSDPLQLSIYRVAYAELQGVPLEQVDAAFVYVRDGAVVRPGVLHTRAELEDLLRG